MNRNDNEVYHKLPGAILGCNFNKDFMTVCSSFVVCVK